MEVKLGFRGLEKVSLSGTKVCVPWMEIQEIPAPDCLLWAVFGQRISGTAKWRHTLQGKLFMFMVHFAYFCLPKRVTIAKVSIYTFCVDLRQNYEWFWKWSSRKELKTILKFAPRPRACTRLSRVTFIVLWSREKQIKLFIPIIYNSMKDNLKFFSQSHPCDIG